MPDASLDERVRSRLPGWTTVFQRLVSCPSTFEQEESATALVEQEIARLGLLPIPVPFAPAHLQTLPEAQPPYSSVSGRRDVVARLPGSGGGRSLILNAHLDVVPSGDASAWTYPPFSGKIVDNVIYGRGTYDDKAGVIICLAVLELVKSASLPLRGDVIAQFVLEDEITGNGSLLCLEAGHGADAAIIVDGTRGQSGINAHAGNIRFGVSMPGRATSVSVSHLGINAAEMLAYFLLELRETILSLNKATTPPWTKFPSPNQMSVVALACEEVQLTVPAAASAVCFATFTPPLDLAGFRDLVEDTGKDFAARHNLPSGPAFDWSGFGVEPVASSSRALEQVVQASAAKVTNATITFGPSTGTSDLRHFTARGIPCVLFGPGNGQNPHRADECYDLNSLPEMIKILFHSVNAWCG